MKNTIRLFTVHAVCLNVLFATTCAFSQGLAATQANQNYQTILDNINAGEKALVEAKNELSVLLGQMNNPDQMATDRQGQQIQSEDLNELDAKIGATQTKLARTRNQITRVSSIIADRQTAKPNLINREQQLAAQRDEKNATLKALEAELDETSTNLIELTGKMEAEGATMLELNESIENLNDEIQQVNTAIANAENEQRQLAEQAAQQTQTLSASDVERQAIKNQIALKTEQLEQKKQRLAEALNILDLSQPGSGEKTEAELQREYENNLKELASIETNLKKVSGQVARAERLASARQDEIGSLQARLSELERMVQNSNEALMVANGKSGSEGQRLEELNRELKNHNTEIARLNEEVVAADAELKNLQEQLSNRELSKEQLAAKQASLQESLNASRSQTNTLAEQLAQKQKAITVKSTEISEIESEIERLQAQNQLLADTLAEEQPDNEETQQLSEADKKLRALNAKLASQQALLQEERNREKQARLAIEQKREEAKQLERDNFTTWEETGWDDLRIEQLEDDLREIQRDRSDAEAELAKVEADLKEQKEVEARLKKTHTEQVERKAKLQQAVDTAQKAINDAQYQARTLSAERKLLEKENAQTEKLIRKTEKELARLE